MAASRTTRRSTNPGQGNGWGGPAKGTAERGVKAEPFEPGNTDAAGPHDFSVSERMAMHLARLERIAERAEAEGRYNESISATTHAMNRIDGTPVSRNINVQVDDVAGFDDATLTSRRAELERKLREVAGGAASSGSADKLPGLVH